MASEFAHDNPVYTLIEPMYPRWWCTSPRTGCGCGVAALARQGHGGVGGLYKINLRRKFNFLRDPTPGKTPLKGEISEKGGVNPVSAGSEVQKSKCKEVPEVQK